MWEAQAEEAAVTQGRSLLVTMAEAQEDKDLQGLLRLRLGTGTLLLSSHLIDQS